MRILFTRFPLDSRYGGAEVQTMALMSGLIARGHAVAFLGSCPTLLERTGNERIPHAKLDIGLPPVTTWGAISFTWRKRKMREKLTAALDVFSEHRNIRLLDAIFMLSLSEKLLLTEEAHRRGASVFWIEHDRVGRWLRKNPWLPTLRRLSAFATTICVSDLSKTIYEELDFKNVIALSNGVDIARLDTKVTITNSQFLIPHSPFRVGCIARLTEDKGVDLLIEAVADLPDINLTIVGRGPEEGYLQARIDEIGRGMNDGGHMTLMPSVDDLAALYRSLDVLVLPSRDHDPFGLVAAEAMMLGVPVIVTDQCGIAGYLTDGEDAIVVAANSAQAIREGITRMRDLRMQETIGARGRLTARTRFSLQRMVTDYLALLGTEAMPQNVHSNSQNG